MGEKLRFFVFTLVLTTQNTQYFIKVSLLKFSVGKQIEIYRFLGVVIGAGKREKNTSFLPHYCATSKKGTPSPGICRRIKLPDLPQSNYGKRNIKLMLVWPVKRFRTTCGVFQIIAKNWITGIDIFYLLFTFLQELLQNACRKVKRCQ